MLAITLTLSALAGAASPGANTLTQVSKLLPSTPMVAGGSGYEVAIDGDLCAVGAFPANTGGIIRIAVGANREANLGAVYVFEQGATASDWTEVARIIQGDNPFNVFGSDLALDGDTLLVSAPQSELGDQRFAGLAQPAPCICTSAPRPRAPGAMSRRWRPASRCSRAPSAGAWPCTTTCSWRGRPASTDRG